MRRKAKTPDAGELTKHIHVRVTPARHKKMMRAALESDMTAQTLVTLAVDKFIADMAPIPAFAGSGATA